MLNDIQQTVFTRLGYSELSKSIKTPLVNLHTGEMSKVGIPDGFVFKEISLHHSLTEIDMLCSVPMMKTHGLATINRTKTDSWTSGKKAPVWKSANYD